MTDPTNGSQLVIVNTPAGERQLKRLSPADWVKLGNTLRASRKAQLRAEIGASVAQRARVLRSCLEDAQKRVDGQPQDKAERMIRDALKAALDATRDEERKALDAFDRLPLRARDVEEFVNTLEGQYAAILYSLQKDKPDAGEADFNALELQPGDWLGITANLLNMRTVAVEGGPSGPLPGTGESPPPSPTATETSTPTQTESATT